MEYLPYSDYKPSKVDWIDQVPKHWVTWKVTHGFNLIGSGTTPKSDNQRYYEGGNVAWITTSELRENTIKRSKLKLTADALKDYSTLKKYKPDALVFAMYGATIGRLGILGIEATVNQACCVFDEPEQFHTKFFFYWLWMRRDVLVSLSVGGGQPNLSQDDLKKIRVPAPSIEEQQTIASFLDHKTQQIDQLIEKKKALIEKLEEQRIAVITQAVTKGLDKDVKLVPSGVDWLGDVPEGWEVKPVKYMAKILRGKFSHRPRNDPAFYDGEYPFIQTGDVSQAGKYVNHYTQTLNARGFGVSKEFPSGTLVMTIAANIGDMALINFNACFPDSIVGFSPEDDVQIDFLYYMFLAMKNKLMSTAVLNTQLNLNIDRISSIFTVHPNKQEQTKIILHLEVQILKIEETKKSMLAAIEKLQEYRSALITAAVTGKIDVRDWQAPTEIKQVAEIC